MRKFYFFLAVGVIGFSSIFIGLVYSRNGIPEWWSMRDQMSRTKSHIAIIERDNQELRRRLNLAITEDRDALDYHLRVRLGMLKPNELLYLE
jgi:cell division protein FtsB